MTTPLPAIGETVSLHGGTIARVSEAVFVVTQPNGKLWHFPPNVKLPTVAYAVCVNRLRRCAGLPGLPLPCAKCGVNPRYEGVKNSYCADCKRGLQAKYAPKTTRQTEDTVARAMAQAYLETKDSQRYSTATGLASKYAAWGADADALIARREAAGERLTRRAS